MNGLQGYDPIDEDLMRFLQELAIKHFDGHLTIMRFTTNWRISFLTPEGRGDIEAMAVGATFRKAAIQAIDSIGSVVEMSGKLLPEPDWGRAPEWAQWYAIDANGVRTWYETKPSLQKANKYWSTSFGKAMGFDHDSAAFPRWKETLRQRPNDA